MTPDQQLTQHPSGTWRADLAQLQEQLAKVTKERDKARKALRDLYDVQNGPPLIKYEDEWNAAMEKAKAALDGSEEETP